MFGVMGTRGLRMHHVHVYTHARGKVGLDGRGWGKRGLHLVGTVGYQGEEAGNPAYCGCQRILHVPKNGWHLPCNVQTNRISTACERCGIVDVVLPILPILLVRDVHEDGRTHFRDGLAQCHSDN